MKWKQKLIFLLSLFLISILLPINTYAAQSQGTSYQVNEVFFGAGGALHNCGTTYCAKESIGETTVGNTKGTTYQAQGGFNTNRFPFLQFIVNGTSTDLGGLSTGSATTTTATFSVKTYLASSYQVVTVSTPPKNNAYTMHALSSATASSPGTEQFGINLVANTSPTVGANAVQVPSSSFSFGSAVAGYNTTNLFKYNQGDVIASSNKSSGETDYTISYLYNISVLTPGGFYSFNDILVATSTF